MAVKGIDHVNIRTLDVAGTAAFYVDLLGLRYDGPQLVDGFERNWLYDTGGRPAIHLRELAPAGEATGAVDHLAFACDDMAEVTRRLKARGIAFAGRESPADGIVQLFLTDPNGIQLELAFPLG